MRKTPSREEIIDAWLKYHNLTVEELIRIEPKEFLKSPDWFKKYPVTQEQYDKWVLWAKEYLKKCTGYTKKRIDRSWGYIDMDCGPNVEPKQNP